MPTAICFMKKTELTPKARKTTAIISAAAVITRPVRAIPVATASLVALAEVVLLLDPRHHKHRVVGRETEDHGEEEDQAGHLDRRRSRVVEEAVEPSLLEGKDEDAEGCSQRHRVHQQRLQRQNHVAGEEEEEDKRRQR